MFMCDASNDRLWEEDFCSYFWGTSLMLPTCVWVQPFLDSMGLPESVLCHLDNWYPITQQYLLPLLAIDPYYSRLPGCFVKMTVTKALQQFANQVGRSVAIDFEHWVRQHFFCDDIGRSLHLWQKLLLMACRAEPDAPQWIDPPQVLLHLLPELRIKLNFTLYQQVDQTLRQHFINQRQNREWRILITILPQAATLKSLQWIAQHLEPEDVPAVADWAVRQANALGLHHQVAHLNSDRMIRVGMPSSNSPSILD